MNVADALTLILCFPAMGLLLYALTVIEERLPGASAGKRPPSQARPGAREAGPAAGPGGPGKNRSPAERGAGPGAPGEGGVAEHDGPLPRGARLQGTDSAR